MGIYIWLGVLVLLVLLLFVPVIIELEYADAIQLFRIKILGFIRFTFLPVNPKREERKKKKEEKAKTKSKAKPSQNKPKKVKHKKKPPATKMLLMDIVQTINDLLPIAGKMFGGWLRGITVKKCLVSLVVYNEDFYECATTCGKIYAILYGAYTYLSSIAKVKHFKLLVTPNFVNEKNSTVVELEIRMSVATLLGGLLCFLFHGGLSLYQGPLFSKQPKTKKNIKTTHSVC